jgi:large subunit ribosomal protein L23
MLLNKLRSGLMHNEKLFTLIKSPIVTEKSARVGESSKQIVFKVDLTANKREIKKAVEELFKVEVTKVTTSIVKGKRKRNKNGLYKKSDYKKAFVSLSKDSEIQFEGVN